jgi:hypothetical protein
VHIRRQQLQYLEQVRKELREQGEEICGQSEKIADIHRSSGRLPAGNATNSNSYFFNFQFSISPPPTNEKQAILSTSPHAHLQLRAAASPAPHC